MSIDWVSRSQAVDLRIRNFVEGDRPEGRGDALLKFSPRDGALLYRLPAGQSQDVNEVVASTRRAFDDGRWSGLRPQRRREVLCVLASLIEANREELALLECLDVGKPISEALSVDVSMAAASIRFNAEASDKVYGHVYAADQSNLSFQLRRPLGVVAGIVGWNFPLVLAASKIGPALATGNCLILKPSELTSLSAGRVAELALEAGVPEGVLNVVHGGPAVGEALAQHPDVDLISFTGSTQTGKRLLIAAGQSNMKRLILECGGKAPNIVFEDGPSSDAVAQAIVGRAFWNQGQVCTASSRLLVQESIKDDLLQRLIDAASRLQPEDPLQIETKFGAVVGQAHRNKILGYIEGADKEGARAAYRSNALPPIAGGFYVPPVIFDHVSSGQKIAQEEIFGPVLSVISFRDEAQAINIANDTIYGLSAILWTKDLGRAHRVSMGLQAGWIAVNATDQPTGGPGVGVMSIAGHKASGLGTEGGLAGLSEYMSKTAVQFFV